jgi:hypothetical protein
MSELKHPPVTHVFTAARVLKHVRELTLVEAREVIVRLCDTLEVAQGEIGDLKRQLRVRGHG